MREIWKNYINKCKENIKLFYDSSRKAIKSSFEIAKTITIDFITKISKNAWDLIKAIFYLIESLFSIILYDLMIAIGLSGKLLITKLIEWINKL